MTALSSADRHRPPADTGRLSVQRARERGWRWNRAEASQDPTSRGNWSGSRRVDEATMNAWNTQQVQGGGARNYWSSSR